MKRTSRARAALVVAGVELRAAVRDRNAWLYAIVLPLAMYPVLFWVLLQGVLVLRGRDDAATATVAVATLPDGPDFERVAAALEASADEPGVLELVPAAPTDSLLDVGADALVVVGGGEAGGARLLHDSREAASRLAVERVEPRLRSLSEELRAEAAAAHGSSLATLTPFELDVVDVARPEDLGGLILSFVLPLTLVVMTFFGAFFPAIDSTAGEKERGTAETTMLLPLPRGTVLLGKVLATSASGLTAVVLNALGMGIAAEQLLSQLDPDGRLAVVVPWKSLLAAVPVVLAFVVFTSAVLVAGASHARSFKQGQALLGPAQLLFVAPAMVGVIPGVELTPALALVPVVQTVLSVREALSAAAPDASLPLAELTIAFVSQLVYAFAAVRVALAVGSREKLSFGGAA